MPNFTTTATASDFSRKMGDTVSDMVAGLQRVNARRAASRVAAQATSRERASSIDDGRCEVAIPPLSSGFAFAAWLS